MAAFSVVALISACAKNPVTGRPQLALISEKQEISMGKQAHQEINSTMGLVQDEALQSYVQELGEGLAAKSERPKLPWTFRVIDDASVNAFALPGGYIYVTRGMMTHLNSEAELAAVLGHEIGHVTARHAVGRLSTAQLAQVGLIAGMILKPELQQYGNLAQLGMGLLLLKNSRDDERQSDKLGLRYMTGSGYAAHSMVDVFSLLQRVSAQDPQRGRLPTWLSTHPAPEGRIQKTEANIAKLGTLPASAKVEREAYLRRIDGMVYGENPREGYFEGNAFFHPEFKFTAAFPQGWQTMNQKQGVVAVSPRQDAMVQITLARGSSPQEAATQFLRQPGVRTQQPQAQTINGMPALVSRFMAGSQQQQLAGVAVFVAHEGKVFQILGYTAPQLMPYYETVLGRSLASFARLSDPKALAVQPRRLQIVRIDEPMALEQFAKRFPSEVPLQSLAMLNQLDPQASLDAGMLAKRVVPIAPSESQPQPGWQHPDEDLRARADRSQRPADARRALDD